MAIFISYSHKDKDFVDKLATNLVLNRVHVFLDRWEMNVGESITNKIQQAITEASFLIVVLSKNSVKSDWCNREITSGLLLELDLKRVVILPVLIEDCEIPLFLRDKYFADFRSKFDNGLKDILTSISSLGSENSGRIKEEENYFTDFATACGKRGDYFEFHIDVVEFSILPDKPYTLLVNVIFVGDKKATKEYEKQLAADKKWEMPNRILELCAKNPTIISMNAHILHGENFTNTFILLDPKTHFIFKAYVTIKRLGILDGKDKLYYFGGVFEKLWQDASERN